jgi:AraC-like DNA-binding protein
VTSHTDSRRVRKVEEEIARNYNKQIYLKDLADMVGMTPTAFSRFFKIRTGRTLSDYIIDIRMGHAARMLVDTTMTMSEICYECGFNNISNFNRIFKKRKGCCPKEFRENYLKTKLII